MLTKYSVTAYRSRWTCQMNVLVQFTQGINKKYTFSEKNKSIYSEKDNFWLTQATFSLKEIINLRIQIYRNVYKRYNIIC